METIFHATKVSGFIDEDLLFGDPVSKVEHPKIIRQKSEADYVFKSGQLFGLSLWRGSEGRHTAWHIYIVQAGDGLSGRELPQLSEPVHVLLEAHGKQQCAQAKRYLNVLLAKKPLTDYSAEEFARGSLRFAARVKNSFRRRFCTERETRPRVETLAKTQNKIK